MFRRLNNVFRPNQQGHRGRDAGSARASRSELDYHSACTLRLVRSTSLLVVGERSQAAAASASGSVLKRSKSSVSIESSLRAHRRQEDRIWLYSQSRNCLEYLEALVELRRKYTQSVGDFQRSEAEAEAAISPRKKPPPPPPPPPPAWEEEPGPGAPVPDEEDTLRYLDAVIASCDSEAQRKAFSDDGHADVDLVVASTSAQHGLHSNWVLRVPRAADGGGGGDGGEQEADPSGANQRCRRKQAKGGSSSSSSSRRLQRNPIHLPKVVESALQTLRFRPRMKKR